MRSWIAERAADGCGMPAHPAVAAAGVQVTAPGIAQIPSKTPFFLKVAISAPADATSDPASSIDISFDETDDGCLLCNDGTPFARDTGSDAIIRSRLYRGVPNPSEGAQTLTRYVPDLSDLVANRGRPEEMLPSTNRRLTFSATVRAQHWYGATTSSVALELKIVDIPGSSGFRFLKTPALALAGEKMDLYWDDGGTGAAEGFLAGRVRLWLCTSDCSTPEHYDVVLTDERGESLFPNNGHAEINVPRLDGDSSTARILIENEGATFFNVTPGDITYRSRPYGGKASRADQLRSSAS
jgi:hypothetical protein